MSRKKNQILIGFAKMCIFAAVFVAIILAVIILSKKMLADAERRATISTLPKISISLNDVDLETVKAGTKDIKYPGNEVALAIGDNETIFSDVELKGRGNSTWGREKSPFQLKFKNKVDFMGMGKGKKWILLANYFDITNLRNAVAFKLEALLGQVGALEGRFAELYIDGDYQGVYYVTEKIGVGKDRIDLKNDLGVVAEFEYLHDEGDECYRTDSGVCFVLKDSVNEDYEDFAMKDFVSTYNELEQAVEEEDFEKVEALLDLESLAKYYLLSEFTANPDSFLSSWYFYKDGLVDKIHVGPGWDYDYALSNKLWHFAEIEQFYSPETEMLQLRTMGGEVYDDETGETVKIAGGFEPSKLVYKLLEYPEFEELVERTYKECLFGKKALVLGSMKIQAGLIRDAAILDIAKYYEGRNELWEEVGEYSVLKDLNVVYDPDLLFDTEVKYLIDWVDARFDYLDWKYTSNYDKMVTVI